jgi:hypothetical protein
MTRGRFLSPIGLTWCLINCAGHAAYAADAALEKQVVRRNTCEGIDLEAGYVVRSSRVEDPFDFLPWVATRERRAAAQISNLVDKQPFRYDKAITGALEIIRNESFLPDSDDRRVRIGLEIVSVENCAKPDVDLVYRVYSSQIIPTLNGAVEARQVEKRSPQSTAGLAGADVATMPIHFVPIATYDTTDKLGAGGRLEVGTGHIKHMPFGSLLVEGQGSPSMMSFSAALSGSADTTSWISHLEWRLNYRTDNMRTGAGELKKAFLSGQVSGSTRTFGNGSFAGRFGALLDGGNQHGTTGNFAVPSNTTTASGFGTLKLYVGLDSNLRNQVFSISYGLELGARDPAAGVDWRKHIADVRHEFWYPLGDHRLLELESRLTAGLLDIPGRIPLPERFFGGNHEELFIPGESWQIRANPVVRAIPGSRFYNSADGAGADRFVNYNLTAGYTIWRRPLVPSELTQNQQFQSLLSGQLTTATSVEQIHYATRDPHYRNLVEALVPLQADLADLKTEILAAQSAHPGQFADQFKACISAINMAALRANSAAGAKDFQQYGLISALLSVDPHEDRLGRVTRACTQNLDTALDIKPGVESPEARVDGDRQNMENEFAKIDKADAVKRANGEISFVRRTLDTLFREVNLASVGPVGIFDLARIGPAAPGDSGLRYGPGAGIRFGLSSVMNLTVGYARNIRKGPGEGNGNVFMSLNVRDLFH